MSRSAARDTPPEDEDDLKSLRALASTVSGLKQDVTATKNSLSSEYGQAGLEALQRKFTAIEHTYMRFTQTRDEVYYDIIQRSARRRSDTQKLSAAAKNVARLFEKYARKPKSYSKVESESAISKLINMIDNLLSSCSRL